MEETKPHKKYYEDHKEEIRAYQREYYKNYRKNNRRIKEEKYKEELANAKKEGLPPPKSNKNTRMPNWKRINNKEKDFSITRQSGVIHFE